MCEQSSGDERPKSGDEAALPAAPGSWSDEWDDDDDVWEEEDYMDDADCGMMTDEKGRPEGCMMAGSEYCEFTCPHRDSLYRDNSTNDKLSCEATAENKTKDNQ